MTLTLTSSLSSTMLTTHLPILHQDLLNLLPPCHLSQTLPGVQGASLSLLKEDSCLVTRSQCPRHVSLPSTRPGLVKQNAMHHSRGC
jgi:hypothetical protein